MNEIEIGKNVAIILLFVVGVAVPIILLVQWFVEGSEGFIPRLFWWVRNKLKREDYDKRIDILSSQIANTDETISLLRKELACVCDYGGHDWVFNSHQRDLRWEGFVMLYDFKCSRCGCVKTWKWHELTKKEQIALTDLGVPKIQPPGG